MTDEPYDASWDSAEGQSKLLAGAGIRGLVRHPLKPICSNDPAENRPFQP